MANAVFIVLGKFGEDWVPLEGGGSSTKPTIRVFNTQAEAERSARRISPRRISPTRGGWASVESASEVRVMQLPLQGEFVYTV